MHLFKRNNASVAATISLLLCLVGCRGDNLQQSLTRVRIGTNLDPINFCALYLANELGHFRQHGLDVTIEELSGGSKALQAMLGGSVDVVSGSYEFAIQLAVEGQKVQSFMTMFDRPGYILAASSTSDRKIKTIQELKGAIVGVTAPGSGTHNFLNYLLVKHGVALQDVSITGIGTGPTAIAAFDRGRIDAGILTMNGVIEVKHRFPNLVILADTRTAEECKNALGTESYPAQGLIATSDWLHHNPETAGKLVKAVLQTMEWIRGHSAEQLLSHMPTKYRSLDPAVDLESLRMTIPRFSPDGLLSHAAAEIVRSILAVSSEKIRNAKLDLASTYTNEFIKGR